MDKKVNGLGIGDVLIFTAELLHDLADEGMEAEVSIVTKLKSTGLRYKVTTVVTLEE